MRSEKNLYPMLNLKILKKHQLSANAKRQNVQPVLTFKKANTSDLKAAEISTCISLSHVKVSIITCPGCGEHYTGQTGDTLRHQMTVHQQKIRETKIPVHGSYRTPQKLCQKHYLELYSVSYL